MESSSKIDLKDVSWWISIKDVCRLGALVIARFLKERCISLIAGGRQFCTTCKQNWSRCEPPSTWKTYSSKMGLSKIQNLEHKYRATKSQLPKKTDGAQSSIEKRPIPPKDISSRAWCLVKGPWKDPHNHGPIMSPHTYITLLLKPIKRNKKKEEKGIVRVKYKGRQATHEDKMPKGISREKKIIDMCHVLR